jgi:hypothetical protein
VGRGYALGRVVKRRGAEKFRVVSLKVVHVALMNVCSERGGMEVGQNRELETKNEKLLLKCTEKK